MVETMLDTEVEQHVSSLRVHLQQVTKQNEPPIKTLPFKLNDSIQFLLKYFANPRNRLHNPNKWSETKRLLKIGTDLHRLADFDHGKLRMLEEVSHSHSMISDKSKKDSVVSMPLADPANPDEVAGLSFKIRERIKRLAKPKEQPSKEQAVSPPAKPSNLPIVKTADKSPANLNEASVAASTKLAHTSTLSGNHEVPGSARRALKNFLRVTTKPEVKLRERRNPHPVSNSFFSLIDHSREDSKERARSAALSARLRTARSSNHTVSDKSKHQVKPTTLAEAYKGPSYYLLLEQDA